MTSLLPLPTFILRLFCSQKSLNAAKVSYSISGLAPTKATSSAKARKNNYRHAIVYKCYSLLSSPKCPLQYSMIWGYTLSKYMVKSSGDAPSPYLTPLLAGKAYPASLLSPTIPYAPAYILYTMPTRS